MADWFTKQSKAFMTRLKQAFWDSVIYDWDDLVCDWDGVSDEDWFTKQSKAFATKLNLTNWYTKPNNTWYTKN